MKRTIRLNERELHQLISESVKRVLNESSYNNDKHGINDYTPKKSDDDEWADNYRMDSNDDYETIVQQKGSGKNRQFRTIKRSKKQPENNKGGYRDGNGKILR